MKMFWIVSLLVAGLLLLAGCTQTDGSQAGPNGTGPGGFGNGTSPEGGPGPMNGSSPGPMSGDGNGPGGAPPQGEAPA